MGCSPQLTALISKKNISKIVWVTNNRSTPLDRAHRVVSEQVSWRIRCELHLLLFEDSCRECESRWYWPEERSNKIGTRSLPFYLMVIFHWVVSIRIFFKVQIIQNSSTFVFWVFYTYSDSSYAADHEYHLFRVQNIFLCGEKCKILWRPQKPKKSTSIRKLIPLKLYHKIDDSNYFFLNQHWKLI
jgi:hypothetical protein